MLLTVNEPLDSRQVVVAVVLARRWPRFRRRTGDVPEPLIGLISHIQPGIDRDALVRLAIEQGLAPVWRGSPDAGSGTLLVRCEGRRWRLRCTLRQAKLRFD